MWSDYSLEVVDAVARNGSFTGAAQSCIAFLGDQLHGASAGSVAGGAAVRAASSRRGAHACRSVVFEGRAVCHQKMQITREQCQQIANGWRGHLAIAVDNIVKPERTRQMIVDFYRHFSDVELRVSQEVFNGVWDALADGRAEMAIGATRAIPVGGRYAFRDMGMLSWTCVVARDHPLAALEGPLSDDTLRNWPSLVLEDTSRSLPKRITSGCWIISAAWSRRTGSRQPPV